MGKTAKKEKFSKKKHVQEKDEKLLLKAIYSSLKIFDLKALKYKSILRE